MKVYFEEDKDGNFDLWEVGNTEFKLARIFLTHHGRWIYGCHISQATNGICDTANQAKEVIMNHLKENGRCPKLL